MASPPHEFGKRRPAAPVPSPPVKRSGHVALLVMGTMAVGGGAYALMPRQNCQPNGPGVASLSPPISGAATQPAPTPVTNCGSRYSSGGYGGSGRWWSHSSFYGGSSSASGTSAPSAAAATTTTRGGFGGFAHAIAAHFSGS